MRESIPTKTKKKQNKMIKGKSAEGRTFNLLSTYDNVAFKATTIRYNPLKTLTLEVRFWYDKTDVENPKKELETMFREVKRTLFYRSGDFYDVDKLISIADWPKALTLETPKAFVMFEFTLFPTKKFESDFEISELMTLLCARIHQDTFRDRDNVSKSKREKYYV